MSRNRRQEADLAVVEDHLVAEAFNRLRRAELDGLPCRPVRDLIGRDDVGKAYAVQQRGMAAKIAEGARVVGRKIGLTSPAVQQQLGVEQPDFGMLFDYMAHRDGDTVLIERLLQPRVEAEVAFILGADLAEGPLDLRQVREAISSAVAAIEICDSRVAGWDISFGDTVADNASAGLYVLGSEIRSLAEVEPRHVVMRMTVTNQDESTGNGLACLGDPLLAVQWLARQARVLGQPLLAGHVVLSGALGPMRPVEAGAEVNATISGLGSVSVRFSEGSST